MCALDVPFGLSEKLHTLACRGACMDVRRAAGFVERVVWFYFGPGIVPPKRCHPWSEIHGMVCFSRIFAREKRMGERTIGR